MRLALARLLECGIPHTGTALAYGEPPGNRSASLAVAVLVVRRSPLAKGALGLRPIQRASPSV